MRWIALGPLLFFCACRQPAPVVAPAPLAPVAAVKGAPIDGSGVDPSTEEEEKSDAEYVAPCVDGPERQAAYAAFDDLATRIRALDEGDDPKPLMADLGILLATECFRFAESAPNDGFELDSALALRTWWDAGGFDWVQHFLTQGEQRLVMVPPSPRRTLTKTVGKKHPLASLVCADHDGSCAKDTAGWERRAERAFELRARASSNPADTCEKEALQEKGKNDRFVAYRQCLDRTAPRRSAFRLGHFKAPIDGWLVLASNRRCGEVRAYDLVTGSAYFLTDRCGRSTTIATMDVRVGRVSVTALREAAWMMLVAPTAEKDIRVESLRYDVPEAIPIVEPRSMGRSGWAHCGGCGVAGARQWSWMRERGGVWKGQVSGVIHPNMPCDDAEDHAAELLEIADDSFEEGCAPKAPPNVSWSDPGEAIENRSPASFDDPDRAPLRAALASARATSLPCARKP
jgi:hypothetical protein